jgi:RNA recognition motif-containing protein
MDTYSSTPYQSSAAAPKAKSELHGEFLFVGGVPLHATYADMYTYFQKFGGVKSIDMPRNRKGKLKGFAYVRFTETSAVRKALLGSNHSLCGKKIGIHEGIKPSLAANLTKDMQDRKIFVTNLLRETTEDQVYSLFSKFGQVDKVLVPKDGIEGRGFCYVVMKDSSVFDKLLLLGSIQFMGRPVYLESALSINTLHTSETICTSKKYVSKKQLTNLTELESSKQYSLTSQFDKVTKKHVLGSKSQMTRASSNSQQGLIKFQEQSPVKSFRFSKKLQFDESEDNYRFNLQLVA